MYFSFFGNLQYHLIYSEKKDWFISICAMYVDKCDAFYFYSNAYNGKISVTIFVYLMLKIIIKQNCDPSEVS